MNLPYKIPESVLVIIHTDKLDVLMIERADMPGYWQSVTGSKECLEEPLHATAMREVGEETGIIVSDACAAHAAPGLSGAAGDAFAPRVPLANLRDWHLSNIYEIYPVWRHRYAPGVIKNAEHVFSLLVPRDIPITLSPREHVSYLWLPHQAAADHCFSPSNAEAVLQLPNHVAA